MRGISTSSAGIYKVIELREKGHTISEINAATRIGRSTISKYIKDVEILPRFYKEWENKQHQLTLKKQRELEKAKFLAQSLINKIKVRDKLIIASCLYWAEGAKKDFSISNTDPKLIKTFINYIKFLGVKKKDLVITIRIYQDIDKQEAVQYWANIIGVKQDRVGNVNILNGKKKGKLKYGMCRIRVRRGGYYLKLIKSIIECIQSPRRSMDRTEVS